MKILFNNIPNINVYNNKVGNPISFAAKNNEDKFVKKRERLDYNHETGEGLFFEDVLNSDFAEDEELSKMDPALLQRAKEEVSFEVFMSVFEDKKLIRSFKSSYPNMDIKSFVDMITPGASSRKVVTRILTDSGVNTVGQLGRAMDLYTQKNVKQTFEKATIDFFEILGDLKNKRDMTSFPEFLLHLKYLAEDKGFEDTPAVYENFCATLRDFGLNNLDDFNKKFYYLAPDFNNFEYVSDYYDAVMYISKTHPQKLALLEPIAEKNKDNKKLNNAEKIYVTVPEVVDTLFLQNEGENLGDIEDYIELAVSSKDLNHKTMMLIAPYFNKFENPNDDLRFYRLMHKNNLSVSNFNKMFAKLIISDVELLPMIDNMNNIVNILTEKDDMNQQVAKDFYLKFSDVLNVAYNSNETSFDVMSNLIKLIKDCRFKNANDLLNFYNQCNQPNKRLKEMTSEQLIDMVDLMRFVNDDEIKDSKKFKNIRFDKLQSYREHFNQTSGQIDDFLANRSKNLFLEETSLSIFNKYRNQIIGASQQDISSKLYELDKLNIKNVQEYNQKNFEMERFDRFFPSRKELVQFIVQNQISFDNSPEEQEYKDNCFRILNTLYNPYRPDDSFELIKKLSNSRFLFRSKSSLKNIFANTSSSLNVSSTIATLLNRKVKNYSAFEAFVQKYETDRNSHDKFIDYLSQMPENVKFSDVAEKLDILNKQLKDSNFPINLDVDNIQNLSFEDLSKCKSSDSLNLNVLNKLVGFQNDINPVLILPKAFAKDNFTNKERVALEIFTEKIDADNYPKLKQLLYPFEIPEDLSPNDIRKFSYFVTDSLMDFLDNMSKTHDGKNYNMSLHSKLRIIERFLMDDIKSNSDFNKVEIKQKLGDILNSIYNQEQLLVKKSGDGERILFNSEYNGKVIESVFEKNGMLITAVEKSH